MKLNRDLLRAANSSRAILFERTSDPIHRYFGVGSGFLFTYSGRGYFATAEHVVADKDEHALRVAVDDEGPEFFRLDRTYAIPGTDQDWMDVRFYRVAPTPDEKRWFDKVLPLDRQALALGHSLYSSGAELIVSGFPGSSSDIDYSTTQISLGRLVIPARYDAQDPEALYKHRILIAPDGGPPSYHGLSGALVVAGTPEGVGFVGMMIQGSAESTFAHFIGVQVFGAFLQYADSYAAA
jgi:hypothetical protein